MSHFTKLNTSIKDIEALKNATDAMGLTLIENGLARGYAGSTQKGDYVIKLKGSYDVALKKQKNGTYEIIADWFGGSVEKEIGKEGKELIKNYAVACAVLVANKQGMSIKHEIKEDGTVRIIATQQEEQIYQY